jgi:hypothetical protein
VINTQKILPCKRCACDPSSSWNIFRRSHSYHRSCTYTCFNNKNCFENQKHNITKIHVWDLLSWLLRALVMILDSFLKLFLVQWMPLNGFYLGQAITDPINRMIFITEYTSPTKYAFERQLRLDQPVSVWYH